MFFFFFFYLLVTSGYIVVVCDYLVLTSGYLIATTGYFWFLVLVTTGLAMPTKVNGITLQNSLMFIYLEKLHFTSPFFFEILQRLAEILPRQNLLFWVLWACLAMTIKTIPPACRNLCLSLRKKSYLPPTFLEILQRY